ncbi:GNAT family N-acetyltransferase, partial [Streptomyces venezuelae]|uniref:GNAT family N-acetyltransferase n=1 Tax=Streptomyces venezuelae TaxID=54571 RepID=UPI001F3C8C92
MDLAAVTQPDPVITLDGGLVLRAYDPEADLPEFFRVIEESLAHLRPWMPWVADHSLARTRDFLAGRAALWASGEERSYAIVLDGAVVGSCGLARYDDTPGDTLEIGYWLHPAATGRGLATRAAGALAEQAFRLPGIERVEIVHDAANTASAAVPARLGFLPLPERRPAEVMAPAQTGELQVWHLPRSRTAPGGGAGLASAPPVSYT